MIPSIELLRLEKCYEFGQVYGVLRIQKLMFCVTVEPYAPVSTGQYIAVRRPMFNDFMLFNYPNAHFGSANRKEDGEGSILLGQYFGKVKADPERRCILNTGNTMKEFLRILINHDQFTLTITEHY